MPTDRRVAGLFCSEVLGDLSAYLDGELGPAQRAAIEEHLAGCDVCERFGGEFSAAVAGLRRELAGGGDHDASALTRLHARLAKERGD